MSDTLPLEKFAELGEILLRLREMEASGNPDPEELSELKERFRKIVSERLAEGYYIIIPMPVRKE